MFGGLPVSWAVIQGRGMTDMVGDVRRRTASGVRSVIVLNLVFFPLSFATNMLLGRVSPEALGYYGAVYVLIGTYFTFGVFGGSLVFTRFVPYEQPPGPGAVSTKIRIVRSG